MNRLGVNTTTLVKAQEIMGDLCLGAEIVKKHFGVSFTTQELCEIQIVPFAENTLRACASTHVLVLGANICISEIVESKWRLFDRNFFESYYHSPADFQNCDFVKKDRVEKKWMLLGRKYVPNSQGNNWRDQKQLVGPKEIIPRACEFIYITALTFLEKGQGILDPRHIRTSDLYSHGYHVCVSISSIAAFNIRMDVLLDIAKPNAYAIMTMRK